MLNIFKSPTVSTVEVVSLSPRRLLKDLFAIKYYELDEDKMESMLVPIAKAIGSGYSPEGCYDVFISYRYSTDATVAGKIASYLQIQHNITVYIAKLPTSTGPIWNSVEKQGW